MTEKQTILYVQQNARYFRHGYRLPNGSLGGKYAVEYQGTIYHSDDTAELVDKLLATFGCSSK